MRHTVGSCPRTLTGSVHLTQVYGSGVFLHLAASGGLNSPPLRVLQPSSSIRYRILTGPQLTTRKWAREWNCCLYGSLAGSKERGARDEGKPTMATNRTGSVLTCSKPDCGSRLRIETPCRHAHTYWCACGHEMHVNKEERVSSRVSPTCLTHESSSSEWT
jgi:hypothetical protein